MRALVLHDARQDPVLEDTELPAGDHGAVLDVVAAALNPVDLLLAGQAGSETLPMTVGSEAVVTTDGGLSYLERAVPPSGTVAEQVLGRPDTLIPIPDGVLPRSALAVGIPGIAAWLALTEVGELSRGETVVVLGATGAAGRIAVQAAQILGAGKVVAAGRDEDALRAVAQLGADEIAVLRGDTDAQAEALRSAAGGVVHLVFDALFGQPLQAALSVVVTGGRTVTIGSSAGDAATLTFADLLGKRVLSHSNMDSPRAVKAEAYRTLVGHVEAGRILTETTEVALSEAEDAWRRLRAGERGKLVVVPR